MKTVNTRERVSSSLDANLRHLFDIEIGRIALLAHVATATVTLAAMTAFGATAAIGAENASESREVPAFDRIHLEGAFTTDIASGQTQTHVTLSAAHDILPRITTEVENHTLVVKMLTGTTYFGHAPKLSIALPALRGLSNDGAGSIKITGLSGSEVAISNNGTATISASGRVERESVSLNGTGRIDATAVFARDVTVDNNGVGFVSVRGSGTLTLSVNGVGEIRYTGDPVHVVRNTSGLGRIEPL